MPDFTYTSRTERRTFKYKDVLDGDVEKTEEKAVHVFDCTLPTCFGPLTIVVDTDQSDLEIAKGQAAAKIRQMGMDIVKQFDTVAPFRDK